MLYRFGWLRTRDIAALVWIKARAAAPKTPFTPSPVQVPASALRMAQRTLARLRDGRSVIAHQAPDGSTIYGPSEKGARSLVEQGIPAVSAKHWLRRFSPAFYHHRRLANELAICAWLQGYRIATEHEIAAGLWLGGNGVEGKKPDVIARDEKRVHWIEVERSRRNKRDYAKLLSWLCKLWPAGMPPGTAPLPGGHDLMEVSFLATPAFLTRLAADLCSLGWPDEKINWHIRGITSLYVTEAKFIHVR